MHLHLDTSLLCTFPASGFQGMFPPTHKTTGEDKASFGSLDHEDFPLMNHDETDTAKGRKIAHKEQIEYIEKDANQLLEELIEQAFQHKHITPILLIFPSSLLYVQS